MIDLGAPLYTAKEDARGIGENELVYILKNEFDLMSETDKQLYGDV
jgi:hypothetical protein